MRDYVKKVNRRFSCFSRFVRKGAQVTIFVVLAILIVVSIVGFMFLRSDSNLANDYSDGRIISDSVPDYVDACLSYSLKEAVYFNAFQGGYFFPPSDSLEYEYLLIPFYWDNGKSGFPSLETVEEQLGLAVEFGLERCVNGLREFEKKGYDVSLRDVEDVDVKIRNEGIFVDVKWNLVLEKGGVVEEYEDFSSNMIFNFIEKYDILNSVNEFQNRTPNDIPLVGISDLAYDNDFIFEIIDMGDRTFVYVFTFDERAMGDGAQLNYTYVFAGRYNETRLE